MKSQIRILHTLYIWLIFSFWEVMASIISFNSVGLRLASLNSLQIERSTLLTSMKFTAFSVILAAVVASDSVILNSLPSTTLSVS